MRFSRVVALAFIVAVPGLGALSGACRDGEELTKLREWIKLTIEEASRFVQTCPRFQKLFI
jgi:hypothetical protein